MHLNGVKCPNCRSENTRALGCERAGLRDDSFYEALKKEFGENQLLYGGTDSMIYRYRCNHCGKYFSALLLVEAKIKKAIPRESVAEIMKLTFSNTFNLRREGTGDAENSD